MTLALWSCSKDEEGNSDSSMNMRLSEIKIYDLEEANSQSIPTSRFSNFLYDDKGRVLSYDIYNSMGLVGDVTYKYNATSIVRTWYGEIEETFNLTDGLVSSMQKDSYLPGQKFIEEYHYKDNQLTTWIEDVSGLHSTIKYLWENGNPIRESVGTVVNNYTYSDLPCKVGFYQQLFDGWSGMQVEIMGGSSFDPFLQQSGFFGELPKNLIESSDYGEWKLTYTLNSNGYPIKILAEDERCSALMLLEWK